MSAKRIGIILGAGLVILLVYALIDGGREPLRPVVEEIPVPDDAAG
ncbi:hypothetical protein GRI38_03545 [Altererythrobacter aurantiacus]|uniref:Uncharacterized protein n=1 Tax=Parapontixanthobacter aurantiacus TaxID=1463599 RepID=A0A844ZDS6_9SPHN|nr:hypothetical protein [Parapontixanthobacter aurantiacus]MXO85100.1 hypothetical protein [Parapontixanthobacter aurantiacus]